MPTEKLFTMLVFYALVFFIPLALFMMYVRPHLWNLLFALFLGILTGWIDSNANEVQLAVLMLLAFGAFLGFAEPRRAWRWAVLLAMWIPLFAITGAVVGVKPFTVNETLGSLIAFVPALVGVYAGAFVGRATRLTRQSGTVN